MNMLTDINAK